MSARLLHKEETLLDLIEDPVPGAAHRPVHYWDTEFQGAEWKYRNTTKTSEEAQKVLDRIYGTHKEYQFGVNILPILLEQNIPKLKERVRKAAASGKPEPPNSVEVGFINDPDDPVRIAANSPFASVYGLYAARDLQPYEWLQMYTGHLCTVAEYNEQVSADPKNGMKYLYTIDCDKVNVEFELFGAPNEELTVDATHFRNECAFVNDCRAGLHDRPCNVEMFEAVIDGEPYVFLTNKLAVARGTQLLMDYGKKFWDGHRIVQKEQAEARKIVRVKVEVLEKSEQMAVSERENRRLRKENRRLRKENRRLRKRLELVQAVAPGAAVETVAGENETSTLATLKAGGRNKRPLDLGDSSADLDTKCTPKAAKMLQGSAAPSKHASTEEGKQLRKLEVQRQELQEEQLRKLEVQRQELQEEQLRKLEVQRQELQEELEQLRKLEVQRARVSGRTTVNLSPKAEIQEEQLRKLESKGREFQEEPEQLRKLEVQRQEFQEEQLRKLDVQRQEFQEELEQLRKLEVQMQEFQEEQLRKLELQEEQLRELHVLEQKLLEKRKEVYKNKKKIEGMRGQLEEERSEKELFENMVTACVVTDQKTKWQISDFYKICFKDIFINVIPQKTFGMVDLEAFTSAYEARHGVKPDQRRNSSNKAANDAYAICQMAQKNFCGTSEAPGPFWDWKPKKRTSEQGGWEYFFDKADGFYANIVIEWGRTLAEVMYDERVCCDKHQMEYPRVVPAWNFEENQDTAAVISARKYFQDQLLLVRQVRKDGEHRR
ncbi:hypothetical protein CYMTET_3583 [Cymbomonas tetramitiformis]|uniref:SET domain-containing protein n=1 Tax=Cymbomonas tetramitiformis TaxID=36881 RepID=A0AAE0LL81_9CHLO|nr:hypothetical protein CYMTET_3583 [Cymbomonas tetramitiformis]